MWRNCVRANRAKRIFDSERCLASRHKSIGVILITIQIGRAKRPLMAFVMVLSWSRQIFLRFYLNQRMESFLHGHVAAFDAWGALPRVLLYDNLKSAVLERRDDAIRFHPTLLALSAHYRFEPRPVAVARGNEKGRVERAIRYIRDNFFAGRAVGRYR